MDYLRRMFEAGGITEEHYKEQLEYIERTMKREVVDEEAVKEHVIKAYPQTADPEPGFKNRSSCTVEGGDAIDPDDF